MRKGSHCARRRPCAREVGSLPAGRFQLASHANRFAPLRAVCQSQCGTLCCCLLLVDAVEVAGRVRSSQADLVRCVARAGSAPSPGHRAHAGAGLIFSSGFASGIISLGCVARAKKTQYATTRRVDLWPVPIVEIKSGSCQSTEIVKLPRES